MTDKLVRVVDDGDRIIVAFEGLTDAEKANVSVFAAMVMNGTISDVATRKAENVEPLNIRRREIVIPENAPVLDVNQVTVTEEKPAVEAVTETRQAVETVQETPAEKQVQPAAVVEEKAEVVNVEAIAPVEVEITTPEMACEAFKGGMKKERTAALQFAKKTLINMDVVNSGLAEIQGFFQNFAAIVKPLIVDTMVEHSYSPVDGLELFMRSEGEDEIRGLFGFVKKQFSC